MDTLAPALTPKIVSREDWLAARKALLEQEKATLRQLDTLRAERLKMPWVKVDTLYLFETPDGPKTLADLFGGRSQLLIQHFMFSPDWAEGCVGCSFGADHMHGIWTHLEHRDVKFCVVSRAPLARIAPFKARMGWAFDWVSSAGSNFNYDYGVSFHKADTVTYNYAEEPWGCEDLPGFSVFCKDGDGTVYHTYSCYGDGVDLANGVFELLDLTPKGRGPDAEMMDRVRHHDKYDEQPTATACGCSEK